MENVKDDELVKKFKKLENKLISAMKKLPSKIQDSDDNEILLTRIKSYIVQIEELKQVLGEYEDTAIEIEKVATDRKAKSEISKIVVDLREDKLTSETIMAEDVLNDEKKEKEEIKEIVVDGKVVGTEKKKNKAVRQF